MLWLVVEIEEKIRDRQRKKERERERKLEKERKGLWHKKKE